MSVVFVTGQRMTQKRHLGVVLSAGRGLSRGRLNNYVYSLLGKTIKASDWPFLAALPGGALVVSGSC